MISIMCIYIHNIFVTMIEINKTIGCLFLENYSYWPPFSFANNILECFYTCLPMRHQCHRRTFRCKNVWNWHFPHRQSCGLRCWKLNVHYGSGKNKSLKCINFEFFDNFLHFNLMLCISNHCAQFHMCGLKWMRAGRAQQETCWNMRLDPHLRDVP